MSRWMISDGRRNGGTTRIMPPGTSLASKIVTRTPFSARNAGRRQARRPAADDGHARARSAACRLDA